MQEASFTFSVPLSVKVVQKADGEHLYTEGLISTNDIDLVDDVVTKNFLESMDKQIKERIVKLDIEHEAFKGKTHEEREINKTKIPAGKIIESNVEDLGDGRYGLRVKTEVNRNRDDYKSLKGNLLEKYLDGYSIAFVATEVKYEQRGEKEVRLLDDGILLNTAYTGNACNTKAQIRDVFMKSMDALEDYRKMKEKDSEYEKRLIVKSLTKEQKEMLNDVIDYMEKKFGTKLTKSQSSGNGADYKVGKDKLNKNKNFKMTDENTDQDPAKDSDEGQDGDAGEGSNDVEQKALANVAKEMKSLSEKYEVMQKENVDLKESIGKLAEAVGKITEALSKPVHKSLGNQLGDEAIKKKAEAKSVDPLNLI